MIKLELDSSLLDSSKELLEFSSLEELPSSLDDELASLEDIGLLEDDAVELDDNSNSELEESSCLVEEYAGLLLLELMDSEDSMFKEMLEE